MGVVYNGFIGDTARTVAVGGCGVLAQKLMDVTEKALHEGIAQAVPGNRVMDISRAVQNYVEGNGFSVVREFVGHGVGRTMHEEPQVPNYVEKKSSPKLRPGMTLAIEPMVNAGLPGVKILNDGWTVVTQDGSLSAHFEHTVLITEGEPEIMTWPEQMPFKSKGTRNRSFVAEDVSGRIGQWASVVGVCSRPGSPGNAEMATRASGPIAVVAL